MTESTKRSREADLGTPDSVNSDTPKRQSPSSPKFARTVVACQRCRKKKVRCDQKFPRCSRCERTNSECAGIDVATGRSVPRSYIVHLEDRIAMLESKLLTSGVDPDASESTSSGKVLIKDEKGDSTTSTIPTAASKMTTSASTGSMIADNDNNTGESPQIGSPHIMTRASSLVDNNGAKDLSTGISFAKLMFTAAKFKQSAQKSDPSFEPMIDSSNLQSKKSTASAAHVMLPPKSQAEEMIAIYFAQSNAQLPILHREQFLRRYFEPVYGSLSPNLSLASDYSSMNTTHLQANIAEEETWFYHYKQKVESDLEASKKLKPPAKYHKPLFFLNMIFAISSSIHNLEYPATLSEGFRRAAMKHDKAVYSSSDRLEMIQGLLLMSTYGIMRPSEPGVWYTIGSVLRGCVDLGLHNEDTNSEVHRDPFTVDMRRRLFWCAYSLDRQVCFYLGRPFGIPDESISAKFPSVLDDAWIVENDANAKDYGEGNSDSPSYKVVSLAMIKVRKLQAEAQRILYDNCELPRCYKTFEEWKVDFGKRLNNWKMTTPTEARKMNCDFNVIFFNLNYNHSRLILHGLSPRNLKLSTSDYLAVADASKEVIKSYKSLLELRRINYTWVAVHNLFMAGTSYLYSIYHCTEVAKQTSIDQIKRYSADCLKVLNSLVDRCDAAIHCGNTFEILSAAVIRLKFDPVFKIPNGGKGSSKISIPNEQQLGKQHLSELVGNLDETTKSTVNDSGPKAHAAYPTVIHPVPQSLSHNNNSFMTNENNNNGGRLKKEFAGLAIPNTKIDDANTDYQARYTNSLVESKQQSPAPSGPLLPSFGDNIAEAGNQFLSNSYELDKFFQELDTINTYSPASSTNSIPTSSHKQQHTPQEASSSSEHLVSMTPTFPIPAPAPLQHAPPPQPLTALHHHQPPQQQMPQAQALQTSPSSQFTAPPLGPTRLPSTREGQRIYNLIYQIPDEAIWEQFFNRSIFQNE